MPRTVLSFLRDDRGQGFVEYGVMLVLVAVAGIVALKALGGKANTTFLQPAANEYP